jgi:hypothetical protein
MNRKEKEAFALDLHKAKLMSCIRFAHNGEAYEATFNWHEYHWKLTGGGLEYPICFSVLNPTEVLREMKDWLACQHEGDEYSNG